MLSIQTNVNSLVAQQNLTTNSTFQSQTIQQLTSGYRINQSGDDAAGLAVANKFRNQVAELNQGVSNGNDAVASLQTMDGGMSNIGQILDRLKTLAMQSASGSFTGSRVALNSEFQTDITEINRQAQSIGLNTGGTFAQSLAVYMGAGNGSQAASNSIETVNLSSATVDSQSLGLQGVQAVNSATYNLATSSATSVANILGDSLNSNSGAITTATFKFVGAGFSSDSNSNPAANSGQNVQVNLSSVSDVNSLVTAINSAIQAEANGNSSNDANLKAANITASIVTDSNGNQKLAFNSSNSSFQVQATDRISNALLGNFDAGGTTSATGAKLGGIVTGQGNYAGTGAAGLDLHTNHVTLTIAGGGSSTPTKVTLSEDFSSTTSFADDTSITGAIQADIRTAMGNNDVAVSVSGGKLVFTDATAAISVSATQLNVTTGIAAVTGLGLAATASAAGGTPTAGTPGIMYGSLAAGGGYQLGTSSGAANDLTFVDLGATDTQAITVSANNSSGVAQPITINLEGTGVTGGLPGSGQDIQHAAAYINQQLQTSGNSTLQQITAVVNNDNGVAKLNFVSSLNNFTVSVGTATTSTNGLQETNPSNAGTFLENVSLKASQVGTGGSADISTQSGAQTAVAAISAAVTALGSAQAQVGKGEDQLGFALNLAQSQITNMSSAEANIRDTNVASEAANLSKAQVLQQATIAAMAQANSAPQAVLSLLKG